MSPELRLRLRLVGIIGFALYGGAVGLLTGGWQNAVSHGVIGLAMGSAFGGMLARLDRIPRHALVGGGVGAALLVAATLIMFIDGDGNLPLLRLATTLPMMALSGFFGGMLLSASRARLLLTGALAGALPMPLIVPVSHTLASGDRMMTIVIILIPLFALIFMGVGWLMTRSLADLPHWACLGMIIGLVVFGIVQAVRLFSGQPTASQSLTPAEMISLLKLLTVMGALAGAQISAMAGFNALYPGGPNLVDDEKES